MPIDGEPKFIEERSLGKCVPGVSNRLDIVVSEIVFLAKLRRLEMESGQFIGT